MLKIVVSEYCVRVVRVFAMYALLGAGIAEVDAARANDLSGTAFDWSGPYVGLQAGYSWGDAKHSYSNGGPSLSSDPDGWSGGVFAGYALQSGALVYGLEADVEGSSADGSASNATGITSVGETSIDWQGSLRGRLGLATGNTLFYATAGWAFADVDFKGGPVPGPACCGYSRTVDGWTVGGGADYAINQNLTLRLEYRYSDFGEESGQLSPDFSDVQMPVDLTTQAIRMGVAWNW